jgi:hypothetical protein
MMLLLFERFRPLRKARDDTPSGGGFSRNQERLAERYPRFIESKNSLLFFVALILSRRNSVAEGWRPRHGGAQLGAGAAADLEAATRP